MRWNSPFEEGEYHLITQRRAVPGGNRSDHIGSGVSSTTTAAPFTEDTEDEIGNRGHVSSNPLVRGVRGVQRLDITIYSVLA